MGVQYAIFIKGYQPYTNCIVFSIVEIFSMLNFYLKYMYCASCNFNTNIIQYLKGEKYDQAGKKQVYFLISLD